MSWHGHEHHPWDGALSVDEAAMDELAYLFRRCRELGIEVSEHMPLDTPAFQRAAALHLSRLIIKEAGLE